VDRDKLPNSSCCRFVAKTGDKVDRTVDFVADLSQVSATVDFVTGVYQALEQQCNMTIVIIRVYFSTRSTHKKMKTVGNLRVKNNGDG